MKEGGMSYQGDNSLTYIESFSFGLSGFNAIILILWSVTKLPLYYLIESTKYLELKKLEGKVFLNFTDKAIVLFINCLAYRPEIVTLIWVMIFMCLGASRRDLDICYTITLLSVINLSKLLNNIMMSVIMKGKQLSWASIFTLIIVYIWATWGFFYDNSRFWDIAGRDEPVNYCETLIYCYIHAITLGIRKHEGIGRYLWLRSYFINPSGFAQMTFYNVLFFLFITIIMMKIIFGIIIDTFRVLRGDAFNVDYDKANVCFICGAKKDSLVKQGENFHEHTEKTHDIWGYVNYMITLRGENTQDLNKINSYCKENLEKKSISWLPEHIDNTD
jgi:inositol 1,4,5-triphosphate receptor type 1